MKTQVTLEILGVKTIIGDLDLTEWGHRGHLETASTSYYVKTLGKGRELHLTPTIYTIGASLKLVWMLEAMRNGALYMQHTDTSLTEILRTAGGYI